MCKHFTTGNLTLNMRSSSQSAGRSQLNQFNCKLEQRVHCVRLAFTEWVSTNISKKV